MAKKEEVIADLDNLLNTKRSKMGRIWEIYDELVSLRQSGVRVSVIEEKLNALGFDLKPGNLTSYMHQIKKKKERLKLLDQPATFILENQSSQKYKPNMGVKAKSKSGRKLQSGKTEQSAPEPTTVEEKRKAESKATAASYVSGASDENNISKYI